MRVELPLTDDAMPQMPLRDDGGYFPFMLAHGTTVAFADSATELVGAIIPDYPLTPSVSTDGQHTGYESEALLTAFEMRYDQAVSVATAVQTGQLVAASDQGEFDPNDESDDTLTALMCERTIPFTGVEAFRLDEPGQPGQPGQPDRPTWSHHVPLVLIDSDYEPFSERLRPTGNILWICPSDEVSYLTSLDALGVVLYRRRDPEAA